MKLKEVMLIGMMALLSLSLMQSESSRVRANELTQPPFLANSSASVADAEIAGLLAMAQQSSNPSTPRSAGLTNTLPKAAPPPGVSAQLVDECMEVAEQVNPVWAARMRKACEQTPENLERIIRSSGRHLLALVELKRRDPQLYEIKIVELRIEVQISQLVHTLRHLHAEGKFESPEAGELKEELYAQVQQQVAYSLKARGDYILRLKNHVKALEDQITEDAFKFLKTADDRYKTLIDMD
jgi:hypothetical protein